MKPDLAQRLERFMRVDHARLTQRRLYRSWRCERRDEDEDPCWVEHRRHPRNPGSYVLAEDEHALFEAERAGRVLNTWKAVWVQGDRMAYADITNYCRACRARERLFRFRDHLNTQRTAALLALRRAWEGER